MRKKSIVNMERLLEN